MTTAPEYSIYQIKATLIGTRPSIWRRLRVPSAISLEALHVVLQVAMGWTASHLHEFSARGVHYGPAEEANFEVEQADESRVSLGQVLRKEKDAMTYHYDFGDSWMHKIVLEKVLATTADQDVPRCIAGARACPPEDCGGVWGYARLLEAISDRSDPEHEEMLEWVGDFDPEDLDLSEVNRVLANMKLRSPTRFSRATRRKKRAR